MGKDKAKATAALCSRREFVVGAGAGLAAATLSAQSTPADAAPMAKGHVVRVKSSKLLDKRRNRPVPHVVQRMLRRAMQEYAGQSRPADAWASLFSSQDLVAIKINCVGRAMMSTTPEVVNAIIAALRSIGIKSERIVVFDMRAHQLRAARYRLTPLKAKGVRYVHNEQWGYEDSWRAHPSGKVKLAKLLLDADRVINVPVIKHHFGCGLTGALKNMAFGTIINPSQHHGHCCDPGIANVYNLPPIRRKTTLTICDGTFIQYHGGPQYSAAHRLPFESLLVTRDPVALDKLIWGYIDSLRKRHGMPLLGQRKQGEQGVPVGSPTHVATAASLGLGTDHRPGIKLIQKTI